MKKLFISIFLLLSHAMSAQIITTVSGTSGGSLYDPDYLAFDIYGNLYFPEELGYKVMKIDTAGIITTIAGTGSAGFSGDSGLAIYASVNEPTGIATDRIGNVYFTDNSNNRVRKIDITTGIITTIAGNGTAGYGGDHGPAKASLLNGPGSLCFDNYGNLYITDGMNYRIRKIDTSGTITTIAGNGIYSNSGDGGLAISASCYPQYNICIDILDNIYFGDGYKSTIRKINTSGIITTIAGDTSGAYTYVEDGVPAFGAPMVPTALALNENGFLFIGDQINNRTRMIDDSGIIHTVVGDGIMGSTGDGGPADSAEINWPSGIAFNACGNLYIAQVNQPRIRKVLFNPTCTYANLKVPQPPQNEVLIYPSPATEVLHIDNTTAGATYVLLNILGNMEQSGTLKTGNNTINISRLVSGMYLLELRDEEGVRIVRKVVKE